MRRDDPSMPARQAQAASQLPAGTPEWITPELVALTIRVWQPFYEMPLTVADAVTMLIDVGRLFRALSRDQRP